jgi:GntR family transcriptional regulator
MEEFCINHKSGISVWLQVRQRIVRLIATGAYSPGEQLPTVRELSESLGVSMNTVAKAYNDLERSGTITTRRGGGSFAADPSSAILSDLRFKSLVTEIIGEGTKLGMTVEEVAAAIIAD